ncbi:TIGR03013 family XrtA/PEP-CTERM system glycosyltransferase [Thiohalophilus sp.]|uniref:TIGR03013 family XrtA/PEP-CTERM system glycosyltransferase n=1 Tax=Thiohalophilus sp. TaxID=3028392 RepID=UPI002ACD3822|nr:TIGR03013 family XrtA/PEP-CTERM system glycosyltransferase [Thiohalophilus sp.]MDZ7803448.1 TIGR03013 family XrtA/PEP-CTERM system glycosyltransferase [Thiohalophilus sp.]
MSDSLMNERVAAQKSANAAASRKAYSDAGASQEAVQLGLGFGGTAALRLAANDNRRKGRLRHSHIQLLGRDVPASLLLLAIAEVVVFVLAFYFAVQLRFPEGPASAGGFFEGITIKMVLFVAVNIFAMLSVGLYRRGYIGSLADMMLRVTGALVIGAGMLAALFYVFPSLFFGRGVLVLAALLAFAGLVTLRLFAGRLLGLNALKRRVLVLGAGNKASLFKSLCQRDEKPNFELVNFAVLGGQGNSVMEPAEIIRLDSPLDEYARANHIDDIVIALDDHRGGLPVEELIACKMTGIDVLETSDFFERECGFLKLDSLRPSAMIFSRGFRQSLYRDVAKRAVDITVSFSMLLLAWPLMLITAMGIFLESRGHGSILFRQQRVGQNGIPFTLLKFRSMVMNAEGDGVARWAQKHDPRVTRFGSFIRKTRLDELPQLFNVLRGDMSFVGPRPERPEFVSELAGKLPYYNDRHWVKPGLTGWAQINYPYGASEKDAFEKLQYDLYYVKNQGVALDLMIIAQTVEVVLWGRGAR